MIGVGFQVPSFKFQARFGLSTCHFPHSRYRVVSRAAEGVAAQDAFEGEPGAFERPVFDDGFLGILRACRGVAAGSGRKG